MSSIPEFTEKDQSREEHFRIFGHQHMPDLRTGACIHPDHDVIRAMIEAPGVDIEIPFEAAEVLTEDDEPVVQFNVNYEGRVQHFRDRIAEIEAEIAAEKRETRKKYY